MAYKVLDVFRDLPGTNCGECGRSGCFAFATTVFLEGAPLSGCVYLDKEKLASMQEKLSETWAAGQGKKDAPQVQALAFLQKKIKDADFPAMARNSGSEYLPGPPPALKIPFLGQNLLITAESVTSEGGEEPSVWVKVFAYIYATRAGGAPPAGRWVSFRELPNTVSKSKTFEKNASEIAEHFGERAEDLDAAVKSLGGVAASFGSADRAWLVRALPNVELLLLHWNGGEEFGGRTAILLDAGILDYLDQEAIVFLAEAFVKRLTGKKVSEIIP